MKILQVIPVFSAPFGGPVSVVRSISKELAKNHEVTVYTTCAIDQLRDFSNVLFEGDKDEYHVKYFPRKLRFLKLNISPDMVRDLIKNIHNFDVIHLHSWRHFQDIAVNLISKKNKIPYILQAHGSIPKIIRYQALKKIFDESYGRMILNDASKVIALNSSEVIEYRKMGVTYDKIEIIPNMIDPLAFKKLPQKDEFKKKYGMLENEKMILYLGRIHKSKKLDLLFEGYASLLNYKKNYEVKLVVIGPDDGYLKKAKKLVSKLGIKEFVYFSGFINYKDKIKSFVDADLFVTPSFYGFPITFLEACATGTPIITTNLGDKLNWINGYAGYVTRPIPEEIAKAMHKVLSNNKLKISLSKNCKDIVYSRFSIDSVVRKIENIYNQVVNN